jgi:hypothetical protein
MMQGHEYEAMVLDVLKRAVAEALERKRKLSQYAGFGAGVVWCVLGPMRQATRTRVSAAAEIAVRCFERSTPSDVLLQRRADCDVTVT